jgi:hypothetical protein
MKLEPRSSLSLARFESIVSASGSAALGIGVASKGPRCLDSHGLHPILKHSHSNLKTELLLMLESSAIVPPWILEVARAVLDYERSGR